MASSKKTPVNFQEFDSLVLTAEFSKDGRTVIVKRLQGKVNRGQWKFQFDRLATWKCTDAADPYVRDNWTRDYQFDKNNVPEVAILKAKQFLLQQLDVKSAGSN